jgi:adenine C2-methylase RlmN of 23S rRNA A2503 and tRNA A37
MEVTVTSVLDSKRLKIDVPLSTSRCFVYGQRVSNVKTIDPIQILSLNAAATAYLDESMQTFVADTYRMKTVILDQQKQIDELQARLDRMDDVVKSILI